MCQENISDEEVIELMFEHVEDLKNGLRCKDWS